MAMRSAQTADRPLRTKDKAACSRWEEKYLGIYQQEENSEAAEFRVILPAA